MADCSTDSFDRLSDVEEYDFPRENVTEELTAEASDDIQKVAKGLDDTGNSWEDVAEKDCDDKAEQTTEEMISKVEHEEEIRMLKEQMRMERETAEAELIARLAKQRKVDDTKDAARSESSNERVYNVLDKDDGLPDKPKEENVRLRMDELIMEHNENMEMMKESLMEMKALKEEQASFVEEMDEKWRGLLEGFKRGIKEAGERLRNTDTKN